MTRGLSLYLDALRVLAALIVLASHWAYPRFTGGDYVLIRQLNLGSDAVVLFFVLSGLVIAFAAGRDGTAGRFAFARLTRLWSVAIPAGLLTLCLDRTGAMLFPAAYDGWFYREVGLAQVAVQGVLMTGHWGDWAARIGTNGPWWSLSYEAAYYLLFGVAVFCRGWARLGLLAGLIVAIGVKPLLLMPAWAMGVALWWTIGAGRLGEIPRAMAWALVLVPPILYALSLAAGVPQFLMEAQVAALGEASVKSLRFSNEFLWNGLIGVFVTAHLAGVAALLSDGLPGVGQAAAGAIRWAAGASFSIYIVHYPVLMILDAWMPEGGGALRDAALMIATLAACLAFAEVFERPLPRFRQRVVEIWRALRPARV